MLIDQFNRQINYLRISVTDRCDLRCRYCMNEHMEFLPRDTLLNFEEVERIAGIFVSLGVEKIRITGGEPLVRKGLVHLIEKLYRIPDLKHLVMSSNAVSLARYARPLKEAGLARLNISLDSLQNERFKTITRNGDLARVLEGIAVAKTVGFEKIKINSVLMHGFNDDEAIDLVNYAVDNSFDISFIEEMPLGEIDSHRRATSSYSNQQLLKTLQRSFDIGQECEKQNSAGPARQFPLMGTHTKVGLISPHSDNFCSTCNRVRISAEGKLLLCLGNNHALDLKNLMREKKMDDQAIKNQIMQTMNIKPERHEFDLEGEPQIVRFMNMTGG